MKAHYSVAVIGLGVIGQRMLANMPQQGRLEIVGGWDASAEARKAAREIYPWLNIAESGEDLINSTKTDLVYIGVPPLAHRPYALAAIEAGKAVFCEKPLGVDIADSRDLTGRMDKSGLGQAVNFVFGSARGAEMMRAALASGEAGRVIGADLRLHFARWPRGWQENAKWLSRRKEGGFTREVVSHFLYLSETLFGKAALKTHSVVYPQSLPEAAETHMAAAFQCGEVPVTMTGTAGGAGPDLVEYTVWGEKRSYRLSEWFRLLTSDGGGWQDAISGVDNYPLDAYMLQLDNLVKLMDGEAHSLPDFAAALSVQEQVEAILSGG